MQNKTSLVFDQAQRYAKIKKENEELLYSTLKLYQQHGKIDDPNLIATILDSLQTIEFFKSNCPEGMKLADFVSNAIKYFKYEQYDYGSPIFHYGEYGDKMFILLKGEVYVFGPKPQDEINKEMEQLKQQEEGELVIKGQKRQLTTNVDNLLKIQDSRYYKDGVLLYQKIFQYYSGQCFGDVALTSDKPRSATIIVSSEKVYCLSMRRNDFKIIFQKSIQQARNTIEFFMRIFPGALQFNLSKFIQYLRPVVFQSKTILWQIGDEPQFFFIIVTGRVELYKYMDLDTLTGKSKINDEIKQGLFVGKQQYKAKIVLSQLAEGNIVGQEELLEDFQKRQYYCEVVDITNAYYMEASDFRAIKGNHQDIIDCLRERATINKDYISKRKQLILHNFKNYDSYLNTLTQNQTNKEQKLKEIFSVPNKDNKSNSLCVRSQKQIKGSQNEILQQHIAFDQKRKLVEPQEKTELRFIINNNNLSYIRERLLRQQQPDRNSPSPQKHVKNKVLISQILKKYQNKKVLHEKKDKKRKSIFVTSSQSSIGQTVETENSVDLLRQRQRTSILRPSYVQLRGRKQSGEKSNNNNTTTIINLTEVETRTHQQTMHQITNVTRMTPNSTKFFKTIRSISGK
ncbi:unnamed protein product [Paramecium octaurelia]|uniref:Cyclic nucleotide-binding domain-containing protein n=1 Tax=Paramecium octaurelia TaxID=43137 RepID=A0A8S1XUK5_PAROT|nr:unnamed protein product [Paramecium octaurelia]